MASRLSCSLESSGITSLFARYRGGPAVFVGFDVRFVRFVERQTALNLARIVHEWVNTNDFSRFAPCPNAKTWTSQYTACVA